MSRRRHRRSDRALKRLRTPEAIAALNLAGCPRGEGRTYGAIVWLGLASHLRWGSGSGRMWANNKTLARELGLEMRAVEQGIEYLVRVGKVKRSYEYRGRGHLRRWGRVFRLQFDGLAPVVILPEEDQIRELWSRARQESSRAAEAFAVGLAANVLARAAHRRLKAVRLVEVSVGAIARLLGMTRGGGFNGRLDRLVRSGALAKPGDRWTGFVVFGQLAETFTDLRERLRAEFPAQWSKPAGREHEPGAQERMASMSEAFAALYPIARE